MENAIGKRIWTEGKKIKIVTWLRGGWGGCGHWFF